MKHLHQILVPTQPRSLLAKEISRKFNTVAKPEHCGVVRGVFCSVLAPAPSCSALTWLETCAIRHAINHSSIPSIELAVRASFRSEE